MNILQHLSSGNLALLRQLYPVNGLIHVGAGAGAGSILSTYREWGIPTALFIEAESQLYAQLESKLETCEGWASLQAVVADKTESAEFYLSNNFREHSLIAAEGLTSIWRNLKTVGSSAVNTQSLANILTARNVNPDTAPYDWLVIDCLPAANILEGLGVASRMIISPQGATRCSRHGLSLRWSYLPKVTR